VKAKMCLFTLIMLKREDISRL